MPTFQYEAVNRSGQTKKGVVEADSKDEAMGKLKKEGFYPTVLKAKSGRSGGSGGGKGRKDGKAPGAASGGGGGSFLDKMKKMEISVNFGGVGGAAVTQFSRQLSTLQDAGLPILRSLQILHEQQKPGLFKTVLLEVAKDVEGGSALSEAMARHPKAFDPLYTKMIAAGEVGGVLDVILQRLSDYMEKTQAMKKRLIGAMVYPAVVVAVAVTIVTAIMVFIIPQFVTIFTDFGVELPWLTRALMNIASWTAGTDYYAGMIVPGWVYILVSPIILFFGFKGLKSSAFGKVLIDNAMFYLPIFGKLTKLSLTARFTRTLGTLVTAGVPILDAIAITRDTVGNSRFEAALDKVHNAIREGENFAQPLRETKLVDNLVVNMIDVGEETGELDKMMIKIADNYDDDVDNMIKSMMSLLEPVMIVVLGVVVLIIVAALFMPLPQLMQSVG